MSPNANVLTLPFPGAEEGSTVAWAICERLPAIQKEFADVKVPKICSSSRAC
jgi:hypothetical protein